MKYIDCVFIFSVMGIVMILFYKLATYILTPNTLTELITIIGMGAIGSYVMWIMLKGLNKL